MNINCIFNDYNGKAVMRVIALNMQMFKYIRLFEIIFLIQRQAIKPGKYVMIAH